MLYIQILPPQILKLDNIYLYAIIASYLYDYNLYLLSIFLLKQSNRKKYMAISKSAHYFIIYFYVRISFLFLFLIFQPNSIHRFHSVLILSAPTHSATFPLLCLLSHPMLSTVLQELLHLFFLSIL